MVRFALKNNIIVASDLAYSEIAFDDYKACSILEIPKAKEVSIEFHSLSKTYNMTGWRLGWACGNTEIIHALAKFKTNIDSGIFQAVQLAGIAALETPRDYIISNIRVFQERRDILARGLELLNWKFFKPQATFYLWVKVPYKMSSIEFSKLLLNKCDLVVTPGVGFGKFGEGYFRMALTVDRLLLDEAVKRLSKLK